MLVRFWMTPDPEVIGPESSLREALELMRRRRVRRLPVVRDGELCGMLTLTDLYEYAEPTAIARTSLAPEVAGHLDAHPVSEVMSAPPLTCGPNDHLEDVGRTMRDRKVAGLPVVRNGKLVGIITESNVLDALTTLIGGRGGPGEEAGDGERTEGRKAARIYLRVSIEEKNAVFWRIVELARSGRLDILTLLTHPIAQPGDREPAQLVAVRVSGDGVEEFVDGLWGSGYQVLSVD